MSWERLRELIVTQAEAEIEAAMDSARERAARIQSMSAADDQRWRIQQEAEIEAELRLGLEVELAEKRLRLQHEVLDARRRFLDRVWVEALRMIGAWTATTDDLDAGSRYLDEALQHLGETRAEVLCPPGMASAIRDLVSGRGQLTVKEDPDLGVGLRVVAENGRLVIDNSLAGRLERMWPALSVWLAARLSGLAVDDRQDLRAAG